MMSKKKILMVIDMQNDFVTGVLGTPEAQAIVPNVLEKIKAKDYDRLIFTADMHDEDDYPQTREGRYLPVPHCQGVRGWGIVNDILGIVHVTGRHPWIKGKEGYNIIVKENFAIEGNVWRTVVDFLNSSLDMYVPLDYKGEDLEFEFVGVCTDICVVSNAFAIRQAFPEAEITIDASCCAGTTPELHKAALMTMKSCQMNIINEGG